MKWLVIKHSSPRISISNIFIYKMSLDLLSSPSTNLSQYLLFLMRALANTPFLCSSMIPFNTQKPLSRITTDPLKNIGASQSNSCPKIIILLLSHLMWILSLHKIYTPHDPCCTTTNCVIFIPKWPQLPWDKHEAWTGEFVCPDAHALIQTICPPRHKT